MAGHRLRGATVQPPIACRPGPLSVPAVNPGGALFRDPTRTARSTPQAPILVGFFSRESAEQTLTPHGIQRPITVYGARVAASGRGLYTTTTNRASLRALRDGRFGRGLTSARRPARRCGGVDCGGSKARGTTAYVSLEHLAITRMPPSRSFERGKVARVVAASKTRITGAGTDTEGRDAGIRRRRNSGTEARELNIGSSRQDRGRRGRASKSRQA